MNVELFEKQPLYQFMHEVRQTANFWLFHHVPKTAGSSMASELADLASPYRNIHAQYDNLTLTVREMIANAAETFIADHAATPFRSASGHLRIPQIRAIREAIPNVRMFTILRDPLSRIVSDYRYRCTPKYHTQQQHLADYPTLDAFVDNDRHANIMAHFLCPVKALKEGTHLDYVKKNYCFVGFVEDYELTFRFVTMLMFSPVPPRKRENETPSTAENRIDVSDALRWKVREKNPFDYEIYEELRGIYDRRRAEMMGLVEYHTRR